MVFLTSQLNLNRKLQRSIPYYSFLPSTFRLCLEQEKPENGVHISFILEFIKYINFFI